MSTWSNSTTVNRSSFQPGEVHTIEETGLSTSLVVDLILKHAFFQGSVRLRSMAESTRLSPVIIQSVYRHLQREQLCDTRAMVADDYEIALSSKGRNMAEVALKKSHYAGPAPVPLAEYSHAVTQQSLRMNTSRERLANAMADLILPDEMLTELGAALVIGGTVMLYGPSGNGKTSVAERLHQVFDEPVYIPYAVEVAGQIVTVYDPLLHRVYPEAKMPGDPRWVLCQRPMVKVGGEMTSEMLDTRLDEITRVCVAPLQMKANMGILLIDDFGRQRISPRELLNRWIVPLDRGNDILSLWSGVSFEIPFELLVVFATNLRLSDLAEDAFMRRLKNKIKMDTMPDELFRILLRQVCKENFLPCSLEIEDYFLERCKSLAPEGLRGCYPADLMRIILGFAAFEQRQPRLEEEDVDRALKVYFVH